MTFQEIKIDDPVYIRNGYVTIRIPRYNLEIVQKVKQTKGLGTSDADNLKIANPFHITILEILLSVNLEKFTGREIRELVGTNMRAKHEEFIENNWMRPISELFRKRVFIQIDKKGNAIVFRLNRAFAEKICRTKSFELSDEDNFDIGMESVRQHHRLLDYEDKGK